MIDCRLYAAPDTAYSRFLSRRIVMKTSVKSLVMCALCTAVICILAPISVPIGPVPISLCTFAVMLSGILLGGKWGAVSALVYVLLGAVGVPVFAGYSAGAANVVGPTGGYIVGYIPLAFLCGFIYDRTGRNKKGAAKIVSMVIAMIIGTVVLYALGTAWFCVQAGYTVGAAMAVCVIPFLPGDALKMVVVAIVAPQIERALRRSGALERSAAKA